MTILDTSVVIRLVGMDEKITDDVTIVTLGEYPPILNYAGFEGRVIYSESRIKKSYIKKIAKVNKELKEGKHNTYKSVKELNDAINSRL